MAKCKALTGSAVKGLTIDISRITVTYRIRQTLCLYTVSKVKPPPKHFAMKTANRRKIKCLHEVTSICSALEGSTDFILYDSLA